MKVITSDKAIYEFTNDMEAVVKVEQGEVFKVEAKDCFSNKVTSDASTLGSLGSHDINPATGPIYVEGAEPGDILKVKILDIEVADQGITGTLSDSGIFHDIEVESVIKTLDIVNGHFEFEGIKIPIDPMVGVIGVAPAKEDGNWETATPWKHGGNMDSSTIRKGATVYFPVNVEGGLLALGDCHALMADGEISLGIEIAGRVTLEAEVIKNKKINWPIVSDKENTAVIAAGKDLNEAAYNASKEAVRLLEKAFDLSFGDAYALGSLIMNLQIAQAVNATHTVRGAISQNIIGTEEIIEKL